MPARPTPQVLMIVIASSRAVSVETSKSSLGQDTIASCASVRVRIASAIACACASVSRRPDLREVVDVAGPPRSAAGVICGDDDAGAEDGRGETRRRGQRGRGRARVMGSRDDMRVPDSLISPTLVVVGLGLLASLGWGVGDFGGGLTSRRAPVLGVLGGSQLASLFVADPDPRARRVSRR